MKAHIEMVRTKPDEEFDVPDGGRLVHVEHEEAGLYAYFYVEHDKLPAAGPTKGNGWKS